MSVRSVLVLLAVASLALPAAASATVPPRTCGKVAVAKHNYLVKADQIRCSSAMRSTRAYLATKRRPSGFSCKDYRDSALTFRCSKGKQVFFAIRR